MCVVSMVIDRFGDRWNPRFPPDWPTGPGPGLPGIPAVIPPAPFNPEKLAELLKSLTPPTTEPAKKRRAAEKARIEALEADLAALRAELEELKRLVPHLREYDRKTGQPDCEEAEKVALVRRLAELVGVDVDAVFPPPAQPPVAP